MKLRENDLGLRIIKEAREKLSFAIKEKMHTLSVCNAYVKLVKMDPCWVAERVLDILVHQVYATESSYLCQQEQLFALHSAYGL